MSMRQREKGIQIPKETFVRLCKVYLFGIGTQEDAEAIKKALDDKLDAMRRRDAYTAYKSAPKGSAEEERARLEYLKEIGLDEDYRW